MLFKESREARLQRLNRNAHQNKFDADPTVPREHRRGIDDYVSDSEDLNKSLLRGRDLSDGSKRQHDAIHALKKPIGISTATYSGTGHDFGEMARQSKDGIIHSPAHISASHSVVTAARFTGAKRGVSGHMLRVKIEPHNVGVQVGHIDEREFIIPSGTKLKYSHTTEHLIPTHAGDRSSPPSSKLNFKVHHFTIHSQE